MHKSNISPAGKLNKIAMIVPFGEDGGDEGDKSVELTPDLLQKVQETDAYKESVRARSEEIASERIEEARATLIKKNEELLSEKKKIQEQLESGVEGGLKPGSKAFQSAIDEHVQEALKPVQEQLSAKDKQIEELTGAVEQEKGRFIQMKIGDAIGSAFVKNEFAQPSAKDDVVERGLKMFREEDGKIVARDSKNNLVLGKDGNAITPEAWVSGLTTTHPHYFKAMQGSGAAGGQGGAAGASYTRTEWQQKLATAKPEEKQSLLKAREAGEVTITAQ